MEHIQGRQGPLQHTLITTGSVGGNLWKCHLQTLLTISYHVGSSSSSSLSCFCKGCGWTVHVCGIWKDVKSSRGFQSKKWLLFSLASFSVLLSACVIGNCMICPSFYVCFTSRGWLISSHTCLSERSLLWKDNDIYPHWLIGSVFPSSLWFEFVIAWALLLCPSLGIRLSTLYIVGGRIALSWRLKSAAGTADLIADFSWHLSTRMVTILMVRSEWNPGEKAVFIGTIVCWMARVISRSVDVGMSWHLEEGFSLVYDEQATSMDWE